MAGSRTLSNKDVIDLMYRMVWRVLFTGDSHAVFRPTQPQQDLQGARLPLGDAIDFSSVTRKALCSWTCSLPPYKEMYDKFHAITADITVLDHHKTFIESDVPEYVKVHCTRVFRV